MATYLFFVIQSFSWPTRSTCSHSRVVNAIRRSPHRRGLPMAWLFDGHRQQRAGAGIHRITATRGGICALQFHLESSAARFLDPFGEKIRLLSFVTRFWLLSAILDTILCSAYLPLARYIMYLCSMEFYFPYAYVSRCYASLTECSPLHVFLDS